MGEEDTTSGINPEGEAVAEHQDGAEKMSGADEVHEDALNQVFESYESDLKGKMLAKYFGKALLDLGVSLPEAEVRDLTFIADPKPEGWITKENFTKVVTNILHQRKEEAQVKDRLVDEVKPGSTVESFTHQLGEDEDFDADCKEEMKRIFKELNMTGSDSLVDMESFVASLVHPVDSGKEGHLDDVSIKLTK